MLNLDRGQRRSSDGNGMTLTSLRKQSIGLDDFGRDKPLDLFPILGPQRLHDLRFGQHGPNIVRDDTAEVVN
jgi:hypothetical protein